MSEAAFACDAVCVTRGRRTVIDRFSAQVPRGAVTVLLGPNGSGKTTLMRAITGVTEIASGRVWLEGRDITRQPTVARARAGLAVVEQGRTIFGSMSTEDNLRIVGGDADAFADVLERFPELRGKLKVRAGLLSGGEQQMVMLARALVSRPRVLLVDEMSLGLAPLVVRRMLALIRELAVDDGLAVLVVEQFARLALSVADTAYVLRNGEQTYAGPARQLVDDPAELERAYFGR